MKSILIISDDFRVKNLVKVFQPLLMVKILIVTDFSQGFKEVFEKRPAAVFFQSEISGILGETVAGQLKVLLRDDSPRLVLLRELPDKRFGSSGAFDDTIDLFLETEALHRQFKSQLDMLASVQWRNSPEDEAILIPTEVIDFSAYTDSEALASGELLEEIVEPAVETIPTVSMPDNLEIIPLSISADDSKEPAIAVTQEDAESRYRLQDESRQISAKSENNIPASHDSPDYTVWNHEQPSKKPGYSWLIPLVLIAVAVGVTVWYQSPKSSNPPESPVATAKTDASADKRDKSLQYEVLPAMIPRANQDADYSNSHPGWERYLGSENEYLVFRDQDIIKAYQVICRSDAGLKKSDVTDFLEDATGSSSYTLTSSKEQGSYLLEGGRCNVRGEILIYRNKQSGVIRAIVVTP